MCAGAVVHKLRGLPRSEMEDRVSSVEELFTFVRIVFIQELNNLMRDVF
jgi:hypothetical protein